MAKWKEPALIDAPEWKARAEAAEAEVKRLREALTPSGNTKAAYISRVLCDCATEDWKHHVPWASVKEIMSMISARAALNPETRK